MPAFLVPVEPGLCVVPLEKAIVLIGRESDCDVSLTQSRKVSRKHCCLAQVNNKIVARDLGSTNGIFLNGTRVKKECQVRLGDELMIGDLRFRLQTDPKSQRISKPAVDPKPIRKSREEDAVATISSKPTPIVRLGTAEVALNMDNPVILPDEGRDFAIEPSIPHMPSPRRYPARDESGPLVPYAPLKNGSSEDDVIPLGTDSI
jgi:predicted component of type VI protein secretion system